VFEFFNLFMDRLENEVSGTEHKNFIKKIFGGTICNQLICKGCPHSSQTDEPFLGDVDLSNYFTKIKFCAQLALTIQVSQKNNLLEGLRTFVEGEMLEGENAYYCEQCKKKVNTLKRVCLKKLPNHLVFVLKRFEFDFNTYSKLKINDYYEFPDEIDMEPYTLQGNLKSKSKRFGIFFIFLKA
jgi:ubiquitin carboxyl-terminal hydrolase 9/24